MPFTAQDGLRIRLSGRYPDARYMSLEVTAPNGGLFTAHGVISQLTDYLIAPDSGSANPWQRPAHPGGRHAGDSFTVHVRHNVTPGQVNTLPLAPSGTAAGTSYLLYRVYLPARGNFSQVPLPRVTLTRDGISLHLAGCAISTARIPAAETGKPAAPRPASTPAGVVAFNRPIPGSGAGISPNADTGYLVAGVVPPGNGDVVVIRGKAPTYSRGSRPSPWPGAGVETQYWSMCNNLDTALNPLVVNKLPSGRVDYGCRHDGQTRLDRHGYYTYVVGRESQRAAIEHIPGATFLPFSAAHPATPHILLLRNTVAGPGFTEAIQNVPQDGNPSSAARTMGAYYPRIAICPLAALASTRAGGHPSRARR
jgi:hypothetical protein